MTEILERSDQIDWNALEKQIKSGHGNGGGNFNDRGGGDGDDDGRWHEPERPDMSFGAAMGAITGILPGFIAGVEASGKYESIRVKNYFHSQGLAVPSVNSNAYTRVYEKTTHNFTDGALLLGPFALAVAISAAAGHKLEKIVEKRRRS